MPSRFIAQYTEDSANPWLRVHSSSSQGIERVCLLPAKQELKRQRLEEGKRADARDRDGTGTAGKTGEASASFLEKMRSEQMDAMGLEERMQRNRHYHQRGADVHNFMDRG